MKLVSFNDGSLSFHWSKYYKYLTCPFRTWWKARKYFKRPKFKFYFGKTCKNNGWIESEKFGKFQDFQQKGFWPFASTEYLKWTTSKWFPINVFSQDIVWKDKYDSPRFERPGYFIIFFGRSYHNSWQIGFSVKAPEFWCNSNSTRCDSPDNYWESMLWYLFYNDQYESEKRDIVKARNTLQSHWSTSVSKCIMDFEITATKSGVNFDDTYLVVTFKSQELINECNIYPKFNTNNDIYLSVYLSDRCQIMIGRFVHYINDKEIDVWFAGEEIDKWRKVFDKKDYDDLCLTINKSKDLGPTFKDEFLTKRAVKLIREDYERTKDE